jgi:LPXTG-motif cell wall-anchored protein
VPHHHPVRHHPARHPQRDCYRQGTGFVCPLGSAPHGRPHVIKLAGPGALKCGPDGTGAGCHTRMARPVAAPVRHLPATGASSELMALSGLGLAGLGLALYGISRARRKQEG